MHMAAAKNNFRTWVEIDTKAIAHNIRALSKRLPKKTKVIAVIKGNGYGHGTEIVAGAALKARADYLAVFDISEAVALRKAKITLPILVLKSIYPEEIEVAVKYKLDIAVSTFELLRALKKAKLAKPLSVHVVADTGLGRDGFLLEDTEKVLAHLVGNPNIQVAGLMTHFSGSESREFDAYTVMQVAFLYEWQKRLRDTGIYPMLHASATAGTFLAKEFGMDMVRFGIGMYGLWPSAETKAIDREDTRLRPALSWKARVSEVKTLQAGSFIAYDCTTRVQRDSIVAIVPVGYYDGYPRTASNKSFVLIRGKRARVLGRVMMNMIVMDVTDIPGVKLGDTAILIGIDKGVSWSADDLAESSGTINYEITTRINETIPRIAL